MAREATTAHIHKDEIYRQSRYIRSAVKALAGPADAEIRSGRRVVAREVVHLTELVLKAAVAERRGDEYAFTMTHDLRGLWDELKREQTALCAALPSPWITALDFSLKVVGNNREKLRYGPIENALRRKVDQEKLTRALREKGLPEVVRLLEVGSETVTTERNNWNSMDGLMDHVVFEFLNFNDYILEFLRTGSVPEASRYFTATVVSR